MSFHPPGIYQLEPEGVDEDLQYGVAFYHPRKDHLRRVLHQQEVGNVQSLTALFIGRYPFQQVGTCGTPAKGFQHRQPLPPFFRRLEVGEEDNLPAAQYLHGLAVEAPVHPSGGKPDEVRDEKGGNQCRLLALDNGYGLGGHGGGGVRQQVLAEQALLHPEVRYLPYRMYPAYLVEGFLDTVSRFSVIAHDLARTHIAVPVCLPEYGRPIPHP